VASYYGQVIYAMSGSLDLQPELFGSIQPEPGVLTLLITIAVNNAACINVFMANNETYQDRVRLLAKPAADVISDAQYLLYDTPITAGQTVILSNIFVNVGDQLYVQSEQGATAFNATGTAFVYG
jgi:hypothetical protein